MQRTKKSIHNLLFLFFFIGFNIYAQLDEAYFEKLRTEKVNSHNSVNWVQFGPGMAGYCEHFWIHPTDDNFMYQSPDMFDSYYTADGGESWKTLKDSDDTGQLMKRVRDITFSHQDENFGYAIDTRGNLLKTTDKGKNWVLQPVDFGGRHSKMVVDPTNDNNWYIGSGTFWDVKDYHRSVNNIQGHVYQYAQYGHVYKSTDKGVTWTKITAGLPSTLDVAQIVIDPTNTDRIVLIAKSGLYLSDDQGINWTKSTNNGLPNNLPKDLTSYYNSVTEEFIMYLVEQPVYSPNGSTISSTGGIFKSTDAGSSWSSITGNLALDLTQVTNYTTRDKYFKAVAFWLEEEKSYIETEYPDYPTSILPNYNRIVVNPLNKNEIYIGNNVKHDKSFGPGDIWKTEDGGTTWFPCAKTGPYWSEQKNKNYWDNRGVSMDVNTKFAHLQPEIDRNQETWGNRFLSINSQGHVFICLDQQVLKSTNNGTSWEQIDDTETSEGSDHWVGRGASNLPGRFMLLETGVTDRKLFCSGEHGLWESAPLGDFPDETKVAVKQLEGQVNAGGAHSTATVAVDPKNPDIIYTLQFRQSHRGFFRKSSDAGQTWTNISEPLVYSASNLSGDNLFQYSLTIDYNDTDNIYFTSIANAIAEVSSSKQPEDFTDTGVHKSTDGGYTWTTENTGLPADASVRRLKMDPSNPDILYAALNIGRNGGNGGLYKSTDKASSWVKMDIPSDIKAVNNVFIDRNTAHIFISCGDEEGELNEGGVWVSKDNGTTWSKIFDMPYVWQTEVSPVNSNIILVNVPLQHENKGSYPINPGAYMSRDAGLTWYKINNNIGRPDHITDLKPDPVDENVIWCAHFGQSWSKATINTALFEESINFIDFKNEINPSTSIPIEVNYNTLEDRLLVAILNSPSGKWLGNAKKTVSAENASTTLNISLAETPELRENYKVSISIRPIGGTSPDSDIVNEEKLLTITDDELSVVKTEKPVIKIYPNPAKETLFIKGTHIDKNWKVYNMFGTLLLEGKGDTVDISSLSLNLYLIKVEEKTFKIQKI